MVTKLPFAKQYSGDNIINNKRGLRMYSQEVLANAVKHGNKMDENKNVFLKINAASDIVEIEVKDEGGLR